MSTVGRLHSITPPTENTHDFSEHGIVKVVNPLDYFFSELSDRTEAEALAAGVVTSNTVFAITPITQAPWKELPTAYLLTTTDRVLLRDHQRVMASEANAKAKNMQVIELFAGHFPFLMETERIVSLARELLPQS